MEFLVNDFGKLVCDGFAVGTGNGNVYGSVSFLVRGSLGLLSKAAGVNRFVGEGRALLVVVGLVTGTVFTFSCVDSRVVTGAVGAVDVNGSLGVRLVRAKAHVSTSCRPRGKNASNT